MDLGALNASQKVICRICRGRDTKRLFYQRSFDVLRCGQCGTVFVQSATETEDPALAQEATRNGERYMREVFIERQTFWLDYWKQRLDCIEALLDCRGRLLDIGCGMGYFQFAAELRGWRTVGVEPSCPQAAYARDTLGLDVRASSFEETSFEPASFDLISLWGVIEHVSDPPSFLKKALDLLKPQGLLALQTPNQGSLITSFAHLAYHLSGGRYLLPVYSGDHVFRFNQRTLRQVLEWSGYDVLKIDQCDHLEAMLTRTLLEPRALLRRAVLTGIHVLATLTNRRNQLVAFGVPATQA